MVALCIPKQCCDGHHTPSHGLSCVGNGNINCTLSEEKMKACLMESIDVSNNQANLGLAHIVWRRCTDFPYKNTHLADIHSLLSTAM